MRVCVSFSFLSHCKKRNAHTHTHTYISFLPHSHIYSFFFLLLFLLCSCPLHQYLWSGQAEKRRKCVYTRRQRALRVTSTERTAAEHTQRSSWSIHTRNPRLARQHTTPPRIPFRTRRSARGEGANKGDSRTTVIQEISQ